MKSILDPSFRYTRSFETDLRKSFDRIRREQREQQPVRPEAKAPVKGPVLVLARATSL